MKKLTGLLFCIILCLTIPAFASEVSDLLDKAKIEYEKGNMSETINLIDSARKILDKENVEISREEYIEVTNRDVVKLKKLHILAKR